MARKVVVANKDQPNLKHNVFPFLKSGVHPCKKCVQQKVCPKFQEDSDCTYLAEYQDKIVSLVMDLDWIEEQDAPLVHHFAKEMSVLALMELYFAAEGMIIHDKRSKKSLDAQPLVATYNKFLSSSKQSMTALGLGPQARARIKMETVNVVKQISELGLDDGPNVEEGTSFLDED